MSGNTRGVSPGAGLLLSVAGAALGASGAGMLVAALIGAGGDGREIGALLAPGAAALTAGGGALMLLPRPRRGDVRPTAGLGSIALAWGLAAAIGSLPFLISGALPSPLHAYFEAMSGFSTTGATLIDDVDAAPDAILAWRSISQWLGGVGIVVLIVAIAPSLAPGLQRFFYSEASGVGDSRLTPRIADTAKVVGGIYLLLSLAAALAYLVAGMSLFDAVNHAMTTLATGGFSTHTASFAAFDSVAIEAVAVVFMAAAGVNFALYWRLVRGRSLMPQLAEVRTYLSILLLVSAAIVVSLLLTEEAESLGTALREATFTVVSIGSTTGYTTADFDLWGGFAETVLVLLMVIGGCAGSTAGGMKVIRVALLTKSAAQELQRQVEPRRVNVLRMGGRVFSEEARSAVLGFFVIYVLVFTAGVIVFTASGLSEAGAIGGVATTLNGVGPGLGRVGALENFSALADGGLVMAIFLMLAGRLELFTIVALLVAAATAVRRRLRP